MTTDINTEQPPTNEEEEGVTDDIYGSGIMDEVAPAQDDGQQPSEQVDEGAPTSDEGDQPVTAETPQTTPSDGAAPTTPATGSLDTETAKAIGAEIARSMQANQAAKPEETRKPLTPEERDRMLKRVAVTADTLKQLGFEDPGTEQIVAFQQLLDGVAAHAYTMAEARMLLQQRELEARISPIQRTYEVQQQQQALQMFYKSYPSLERFPLAVREAAKTVQPTDAQGNMKSDEQIMREAASAAAAIVKQFNPDFDLKATPSAPVGKQQVAQQGVPTMAATTTGGRSQGGADNGTASNNPDADIYS